MFLQRRRNAHRMVRIALVGFIPVVVAAGCDGVVTDSSSARSVVTHASPARPRITHPALTPSLQGVQGISDGVGKYMHRVNANCVPEMLLAWCEDSLTHAEANVRQLMHATLAPSTLNDLGQLLSDLESVDPAQPHISAADHEWQKTVEGISAGRRGRHL